VGLPTNDAAHLANEAGRDYKSRPQSHAISKEKSKVMTVMEPKPNKNTTSAQRSKLSEDRPARIEEKESSALTMNKTLSIANALSIR